MNEAHNRFEEVNSKDLRLVQIEEKVEVLNAKICVAHNKIVCLFAKITNRHTINFYKR